jgi:hypothetical protein
MTCVIALICLVLLRFGVYTLQVTYCSCRLGRCATFLRSFIYTIYNTPLQNRQAADPTSLAPRTAQRTTRAWRGPNETQGICTAPWLVYSFPRDTSILERHAASTRRCDVAPISSVCSSRQQNVHQGPHRWFKVRLDQAEGCQQLIIVDSGANLTALATALESLGGTSQGTALFAALPGVPKTLCAPVNDVSRRRRKVPSDTC